MQNVINKGQIGTQNLPSKSSPPQAHQNNQQAICKWSRVDLGWKMAGFSLSDHKSQLSQWDDWKH